jgi:hypothetical protein
MCNIQQLANSTTQFSWRCVTDMRHTTPSVMTTVGIERDVLFSNSQTLPNEEHSLIRDEASAVI